jgi:hypothetical protein
MRMPTRKNMKRKPVNLNRAEMKRERINKEPMPRKRERKRG